MNECMGFLGFDVGAGGRWLSFIYNNSGKYEHIIIWYIIPEVPNFIWLTVRLGKIMN